MTYGALRLVVLGLLFGTFIVAAGLIGIGIPVPLAVTIALLIVGVVTLAVERRMGRQAPVLGITFMVLSGISGIVAVHTALPQVNGWITGLGTLVLEVAALIGVIKLYQRLLGQAGSVFRRRLAARRSWRYEPEATVPVPGPRSAPRFRAVPNDATSTTGRDVLYATANGLSVTVFDRAGARDRKAQTVWLVQLPAALPFVLSSFVRYMQVEEGQPGPHTDHPDFARTLVTPEVRRLAGMRDFPKRWWVEGWYLCTTADGGAKPAEVEEWIDRLSGFASRFPWPALTAFAMHR